jgi:hypothetical protein
MSEWANFLKNGFFFANFPSDSFFIQTYHEPRRRKRKKNCRRSKG